MGPKCGVWRWQAQSCWGGRGLVGTAFGVFSEASVSPRSPREAAPLPGGTSQLLVLGSEREEFIGQQDGGGGDSSPDSTKCHEPGEEKEEDTGCQRQKRSCFPSPPSSVFSFGCSIRQGVVCWSRTGSWSLVWYLHTAGALLNTAGTVGLPGL